MKAGARLEKSPLRRVSSFMNRRESQTEVTDVVDVICELEKCAMEDDAVPVIIVATRIFI